MKKKSEILDKFKLFYNIFVVPTGLPIAKFQADGSYRYPAFEEYLLSNQIILQVCSPYSPGENGVAERGWLQMANIARASMVAAHCPSSMWIYAFEYAAYVKN
jgi:hypothetical protein